MNARERLVQDGYGGDDPVLFYKADERHGCGSNFSWHEVEMFDPWTGHLRTYRTGEHRFQAMKGRTQVDHDYVCDVDTPYKAKLRGRQIELREGWGNDYGDLCWYVMFELTIAKAIQNDDVFAWLMSTHDRPIYEDSPTDDIWGWRKGGSYTGKNLLGHCWMNTRALLIHH